jgi:hypothetical protein
MVCLHTPYLHVEYHEKDKLLVSQWYGTCSSLQYRQALILSLRIAKEYSVDFAVTDRRLLPPLSESDLTWTKEVYHKAFNTLPLKRFAIIKPFSQAAAQQQSSILKNRIKNSHIEARAFEDLTSAYEWLVAAEV